MESAAWLSIRSQTSREIVRFFRQRSRVIGAAGQPLVFWLLFGAGLHGSFRPGGDADASFLQYFFPGTLVLVLLFTAIFSTITIIEDRREGFLQAVLVSPTPRWQMVLGKILGGATIAVVQSVLVLAVALLVFGSPSAAHLAQLFALLCLSAVSLTALGFVIAWQMESTHGFHAVMNLFLMPMWLLSGAFFPPPSGGAGGASDAVLWVMRVNPLSYAVGGVRQLLFPEAGPGTFWAPSLTLCWGVTAAFAAAMFAVAVKVAAQRHSGDLA